MIRINVGTPLKTTPVRSDILVASVGFFLLCWGLYELPGVYASHKIEAAVKVTEQTASDRSKLAALRVEVGQIEVLRSRIAEKKSRQLAVLSLTNGRKQLVLAFDELQKIHPDRMWFTKLSVRGDWASLEGFAAEHGIVADYAKRLRGVDGSSNNDVVDFKSFEPTFSETSAVTDDENSSPFQVTPVKFSQVALAYSNNIALGQKAADLKLPHFSLKFQYR